MNDLLGNLFLIFLFALYFLPTIIAFRTNRKNKISIILANFFFGWTILGWIIILIWSTMKD